MVRKAFSNLVLRMYFLFIFLIALWDLMVFQMAEDLVMAALRADDAVIIPCQNIVFAFRLFAAGL